MGWKESYVFFHFQTREQGLSVFRAGDRGRVGSWKSYEREGLVGENPPPPRGGERGALALRVELASGWRGLPSLGEGGHEEAVGTVWYLPR